MNTKKIVMVLSLMAVFASASAHASPEAEYKPLLKQLNKVMCTIQDHGASNQAKALAQQKMMTIQNRLSPIKMKLKGLAYSKFIAAEIKAMTDCKVASVSASEYKLLLTALRKNTCILMGGGSSMAKAQAGAEVDRIKKELKPITRSLELNDKKAYKKFRKEKREAAMGTNC